jgi:hypothetical protein
MKTLIEAIKKADSAEIDATWAILKYKNGPGILRRLKALAAVFGLNPDTITEEAPKNQDGFVLYHETMTFLLEPAMQRSREIGGKISANNDSSTN